MSSAWAIRKWQEILRDYGYSVDTNGVFTPEILIASRDLVSQIEPNKEAMQEPLKEDPDPNFHIKKTERHISELIWHCAATPEGRDYTVDQIRSWHKNRGWSDIGYHFVIYRDGSIVEGRDIGLTGAHVRGRNTGTIGACYIGGVERGGKKAKDTRTPQQRKSMIWLTKQLAEMYNLQRISGHNEHTNAKACPSFNVKTDELGNIPGFKHGSRN